MIVHRIGRGMVQQIQRPCSFCRGQGEMFNDSDRCTACNGNKTTKEKKILEVHVDPGMRDGQKIVFAGEGDQEPGIEPGDVIFVLDEKEDKVFRRQGSDLFMHMEIELVEAMCGFRRVITTLDDRQLVIQSHLGEVVPHGALKVVLNEGFPQHRRPFDKGRLVIQFSVNFPQDNWITQEQLKELESLLPPRPPEAMRSDESMADEAEVVHLEEMDVEEETIKQRRRIYGFDPDENDSFLGGRQHVQCQTQ